MPKGPSGEKRLSCPAGCQVANPMQCVVPVNQLRTLASLDRDPLHVLRMCLHGLRSFEDDQGLV